MRHTGVPTRWTRARCGAAPRARCERRALRRTWSNTIGNTLGNTVGSTVGEITTLRVLVWTFTRRVQPGHPARVAAGAPADGVARPAHQRPRRRSFLLTLFFLSGLEMRLCLSTLNPPPSTFNLQPSTLSPQPSTFNPQPSGGQRPRAPLHTRAMR